jgi:chaperone required for assembly of F1-ATPase
MSEWKARRFWRDASVAEGEAGFEVRLDDRPVRTPLTTLLAMPTRPMAEAVADEWQAQEGVIDPASMPMTRSANAALDKVTPQRAEVTTMLAGYAETDLLCHRADHPQSLIDQQNKGWNPVLAWADDRYGAPLIVVQGILPATHPAASLAAFHVTVSEFRPFSLTALHDLVILSGSLVLALWVASGAGKADAAWALSRIDEDWQISQWGADEEAMEAAEIKRAAFLHAARFLDLSGGH